MLNKGNSKNIHLDISQPSRLLLLNNSISKQLFVQPGNTYQLTIKDEKILIESDDDINRSIDIVDTKIKNYFKQNYQIELDDDKNKKKRTLSLLNDFLEELEDQFVGSEYQNQLIKYRLAYTKGGTYYFLNDKKAYKRLESDLITNNDVQFQNPAYMDFLFDYYLRRIRSNSLKTRKYPDNLSGFEVIKLETAAIPEEMIQQLVMINFIRETYNTSWTNDNSELIHILDSLTEYGLHEQIRQASAGLAERFAGIKIDLDVPDFSMKKLSGDEINLSEFNGKYVLLDFWFIGCRPCQQAVSFKKKLYSEYGDCLEILSMNNINNSDDMKKYKSKEGLPWTFIKMDENDETLNVLNIHRYPTYYLLDPKGKIIHIPILHGSIENEFNSIEDKLKERCFDSKSIKGITR